MLRIKYYVWYEYENYWVFIVLALTRKQSLCFHFSLSVMLFILMCLNRRLFLQLLMRRDWSPSIMWSSSCLLRTTGQWCIYCVYYSAGFNYTEHFCFGIKRHVNIRWSLKRLTESGILRGIKKSENSECCWNTVLTKQKCI